MHNQDIKIQTKTIISLIDSLIKLFNQEEHWFVERVLAVQKGDWEKVDFIEKTYFEPLKRKIRIITERGSKI